MKLYKYCTRRQGLYILDTLSLRFSPPRYFNDINEMSPFVGKAFTKEEFLKHLISPVFLEPIFKDWTSSGLWSRSYSAFVEHARKHDDVYQDIAIRTARAGAALQREFKNVMSNHVGVCCMSSIPTSNLMWGHYADSHRGLCIEFDIVNSDLRLVEYKAVSYQDSKVRIPPWFLALSDKEQNQYEIEIVFTKGVEWGYEKEHRLVANLEECKTQVMGDKVYYYQDIAAQDVTGVILGIQSECEMDVRRILAARQIPATVGKCEQREEHFSLSLTT